MALSWGFSRPNRLLPRAPAGPVVLDALVPGVLSHPGGSFSSNSSETAGFGSFPRQPGLVGARSSVFLAS